MLFRKKPTCLTYKSKYFALLWLISYLNLVTYLLVYTSIRKYSCVSFKTKKLLLSSLLTLKTQFLHFCTVHLGFCLLLSVLRTFSPFFFFFATKKLKRRSGLKNISRCKKSSKPSFLITKKKKEKRRKLKLTYFALSCY